MFVNYKKYQTKMVNCD